MFTTIAAIYAVALAVIFGATFATPGIGLLNAWDIENRALRIAYAWAMLVVVVPVFAVVALLVTLCFAIVAAVREVRDSIADLCSGWADYGRLLIGREAR